MVTSTTADADGQQFVAEWIEWDGTCAAGQYEPPALGEAFSRSIASVLPYTGQEFSLENFETYINPLGHTSVRLRIAGNQPTGENQVTFAGDQSLHYEQPALLLSLCYLGLLPTPTPTPTPTSTETPNPTDTPTPTASPTPARGCCAFSGANPFGATCLDGLVGDGGLGALSAEVCQFVSENFLDGDPLLHFNPNSFCSPTGGDYTGICPPPSAPACAPIDLGNAGNVTEFGDTSAGPNAAGGSACGTIPGEGGDAAPDAVYEWTAPVAGFYVLSAQTFTPEFDVLLSVRDGSCSGPELACNNNFPGIPPRAALLMPLAANQTVTIVVDGTGAGGGTFMLNIWQEYGPCLEVYLSGGLAYTEAISSTYPPQPPACQTGVADLEVASSQSPAGSFTTREALLTWDTSVLPAGAVVASIIRPGAQLSMVVSTTADTDGQDFVGEWIEWDGTCDAGQFEPSTLGTAFSHSVASVLPLTHQEFTLENADTRVNRSGNTSVRLRIAGNQPTDANQVTFAADQHPVYAQPILYLSMCYPQFLPTPAPTATATPTETPTATPTASPTPARGCCAFSGANPFGGTCVDNLVIDGDMGPVSVELCQFVSENFLDGDPLLHFNPNSFCNPNPGDYTGVCPPLPGPPVGEKIIAWGVSGGEITATGTVGSVAGGNEVKITNTRTGQEVFTTANADGSFAVVIAALERDELIVQTRDAVGNLSPTTNVGVLPPAPELVAPVLDRTVGTTVFDSTSFLYTGTLAAQIGMTPGTIVAERSAVIRGSVLDPDGVARPGVRISVLGHPEYGYTLTRADGSFDLAVNGGELLTLQYDGVGTFSAQRRIEVPWQNYAFAPDVVLIEPDPQVTNVPFGSSQPLHTATGSPQGQGTDSRQALLMFPAGVVATQVLPTGSAALGELNVHITEYTVGALGPQAMPGELPPTSAYTYAFELSVEPGDIDPEATRVEFAPALPFYVDNFLGFPVGMSVPLGSYDLTEARWKPAPNGRVLKIKSISGGVANLDANGDDVADSADETILTNLGVTTEERQALAGLYPTGQPTLWRLALTFFSRWDANWPGGAPTDAIAPNGGLPSGTNDEQLDDPAVSGNGTIVVQNQALRQSADIVGTPFQLTYDSSRQRDRVSSQTMTIPVSGATVPASLSRIEVDIAVGGRKFPYLFARGPSDPASVLANQSITFQWDGLDAYGRVLQGWQAVQTEVRFVYPRVYNQPAQDPQAFALTSGSPIGGFDNTRAEITSGVRFEGMIGGWDTKEVGLGGWDLNIHHTYDPVRNMLSGGGGSQSTKSQIEPVIRTVIGGGGTKWPIEDGVTRAVPTALPNTASTAVHLEEPWGVAVAPDGTVYISDFNVTRRAVIRLNSNGTVTRIAGGGTTPVTSSDIEATHALLLAPAALAFGPDGALYVSEYDGHRVDRIDLGAQPPVIRTAAGNGIRCSQNCPQCAPDCGRGGLAIQANLSSPSGLAVGRDGTLFIGDAGNQVLAVGTDGILRRVASGFFNDYLDLALADDGSLFVAGGSSRVKRVASDGRVSVVAGAGGFSDTGDGLPATQATFNHPWGLALDAEGGLFIVDAQNANRVRRMSPGPNGIVTAVISKEGNGRGFTGEGGPAPAAKLNEPMRAAVAPDGSLYVTDLVNRRLRKVSSPLPGFAGISDVVVASRDGREIYVFNSRGRHRRTVDATTAVVKYEFDYDTETGQLESITDADGNVTQITHNATEVILTAPHNRVTTITLDGNGYVDSIENPNSEVTHFDFSDQGLLNSVTDAENYTTTFNYDASGRLSAATYPSGTGSDTLARTGVSVPNGSGYQVTHTTGEGVDTGYKVEFPPDGRQVRTTLLPDGTTQSREIRIDGSERITSPTDVVQTMTEGPDPRFGMQAPVGTTTTVNTPVDNLTATVTQSRSAPLSNPADPFSFTTQTETVNVNDRPVTRSYNAATRTYTDTSPVGRQTTTVLDTDNRPVQQQIGNLTATTFGYDSEGRLTGVAQGSRSNTIAYDTDGNVESVTDSANRTVSFDYDNAGRVMTQTLPDLRTISLAYDSKGNVMSITPPGRPAHEFAYSPTSLPLIYAPPNVTPPLAEPRTFYEYNLSGQLSNIERPDGQDLFLNYDPVTGQLDAQVWPTGQRNFFYDQDTGKLDHINFPGGSMTYTYDGSLQKSEAWTGTVAGSVGRTYDSSFRVSAQKVNNANPVTFTYDNDDLLTGATIGSSSLTIGRSPQTGLISGTTLGIVTDSYGYNSFGEVTSYTASVSGTPIFSVTYSRDALGRIADKTETIDGVGPTTTYYKYDSAGRLWRVCADASCTTIQSEYLYDDNGNRTGGFNQVTGTLFSATYDDQDRLIETQSSILGTQSYTYTDSGELLTKTAGSDTTTYAYDPLGNLTHVELPNSDDLDYAIDGRDRRVGKKINTTPVQGLLFDGQLTPIAELDGSNQVVGRFVYASKANVPDYVIRGTTTYRIVSDQLGSPRLVIDSSGSVVQRTDYDEFGNILFESIASGFQRLPFGFAGGLYDPQTGFVRFGARDYDPQTGRWTAKDPIEFDGEDANLYNYVLQDPLNRTDRLGTFPSLESAFTAVSIAATIYGIYDNISLIHGYLNGQVSGQELATVFVVAAVTARFGSNVRLNKQAADALEQALKEAKVVFSDEIRQEWHRFISGKAISGYQNLLNAAREFIQLGLHK